MMAEPQEPFGDFEAKCSKARVPELCCTSESPGDFFFLNADPWFSLPDILIYLIYDLNAFFFFNISR